MSTYIYILEWPFSTFLYESDIPDAYGKSQKERKNNTISNLVFARTTLTSSPPPTFGQKLIFKFLLTLPQMPTNDIVIYCYQSWQKWSF